jgi:release factor glutamine methyltransferase
MNVTQALQHCASLGLQRLDAQMLVLHAVGRSGHERSWLLAHDTDALSQTAQDQLVDMAQRRESGEPVAYIVGYKEFYGLQLVVDARVLVPRPDTEVLVEWALSVGSESPGKSVRVVDLGTGSGAIALAVKHSRPHWTVQAVDYSAEALSVARANAASLNISVEFCEGSWLAGLDETFDIIVSNPPYIAALDPHLKALVHEPLSALTSGAEGLDDLRQIIAQAPQRLTPGGWLLLEHGYDQAALVREMLNDAGFSRVESRMDLAGIERCSGGRWLAQH